MDLVVHTYGHIDAMFYILNGMAMLMNSTFGELMITMVAMISVVYYAMRISYDGTMRHKIYLGKAIGMIAMISLLIIPKDSMLIYDHVSKKKEKVDNLPLGFVLPVGMLEAFGDLLTGGFEQAFATVNGTNYRDYGMVFGARLVQDAKNWRIRSPEFLENMNNFIDRCVMVDSMIGYYYTPEILLKSNDIWKLVSTNAGTLRQVSMRIGKERSLMTCKDAVKEIDPAFNLEIASLEKRYAKIDIGMAGAANYVQRTFERLSPNFKKNVELAFKSYVGTNDSAEQLIRQQMMMNAFKNYIDEYGFARASATQESNWRIAGDLAGTYLPILMNVLKGLVYSSFVFMLPMLLISGGWSRYLGYLTLVASFQLWAPLNAVLNMFIDTYSSATLSGIADNIVSFSTNSRIGNYTDKIVAVASGLQMAIPFLAFSIIQGGVGGFVHLAGTITGASQNAASQAASESVTGNKSFDNYSAGNQQSYNQGGHKTDWNEAYASGASSIQHMDGSMEKVTGGGNTLVQSGVGFTASGGATAYKQEDSRHGQVSKGIQQQEAVHQQDMRSASNAQSNTLSKSADYVAHLAEREHNGKSFNYDSMGEQGKSLQKVVNNTKMLRDQRGYGWEQAAKTGMEASLTASTPLKGLTGVGGSASVNSSVNATNSSNQSVGEETNINRESLTREDYNNVVKAASNKSWAKENSIDTGYSDSVRESYEEQQRLEKQASISQQRVDDWHQAKSVVDSQGASSSKDMYQDVVEGIKEEYGVDVRTAHKMADQRSPEAQKVWQKLQNEDQYVQNLVHTIGSGRTHASGEVATQRLDRFTEENSHKVNQDPGQKVRQHATEQGMKLDEFKENIHQNKNNLEQEYNVMQAENTVHRKQELDHSKKEEAKMQKQVNQYEKDRIGKGAVASGAATVLGVVTGGHAGWTIGKPDDKEMAKAEVKSNESNKGAYENAKQINEKKE